MGNDRRPGETANLPVGLSEALAFYDVLAERVGQSPNVSTRDEARRRTLEAHSQWAAELREHFRVEDCLLGVTDSPFDSTQLGLPAESHHSSQAGAQESAVSEDVRTRFVRRYRLGVGGQGEVWLAHDPELDRFVALKVIKENQRASQSTSARIWREAELTGKLEHPNIVPVSRPAGMPKTLPPPIT